jgi:hypothetical protein
MSSNTQQYARPARLRVTGADQLNRLASSFFLPSIEYIGLSRSAQKVSDFMWWRSIRKWLENLQGGVDGGCNGDGGALASAGQLDYHRYYALLAR